VIHDVLKFDPTPKILIINLPRRRGGAENSAQSLFFSASPRLCGFDVTFNGAVSAEGFIFSLPGADMDQVDRIEKSSSQKFKINT